MNFHLLCFASLCLSIVFAADIGVVERMSARRLEVDSMLVEQRVFEGADGFLHVNPNSVESFKSNVTTVVVEENHDREILFGNLARVDPTLSNVEDAGRWFSDSYLSSYKTGVLRQDPVSGEIFDDWPPVKQSAEMLLEDLFEEIDRKEEVLREQAKLKF